MRLHNVINVLHEPLSNKRITLRHLYWHLKMYVYYRIMIKSVGRGSVIYKPMFICNADCIEIADHVRIRDGVRLEAVRDNYGRTPLLTIGSNTLIEQNVHIICHNRLTIGRDVSIAAQCAIADTTHPYQDISVGNIGLQIADDDSFVSIGDGAFLGYGSVILPNVSIGEHAVIGANSVVTHDVSAFSVVAGAPAKVIKVYSRQLQRWVAPAS